MGYKQERTNNIIITKMFSLRNDSHKENQHKAAIKVAMRITQLHKYIVELVTINPNIKGIESNLNKQTCLNH